MLQEQTEKILGDLIDIPTVSAQSNLDLIAYVQDYLKSHGIQSDLSYDADKTKANLFATIGPDIDGGIVLSGHTDVVPVEGQDWSSDPFRAEKKEGRIYGRGACDMKAYIACALAHVPAFINYDLGKPIHLGFTYDEEVGCLGARVLLEAIAASGRKPGVCLIGEPTMMQIIAGHKGCYEYTTEFKGLAGHGSKPDAGVNAVEYAARYIIKLLELRETLKTRAPEDSPFDPPWTTLQVGQIQGGIAHNVIADNCFLEWDFRPINKADADFALNEIKNYVEAELLPAMKEGFAEADIITHVIAETDGLELMPESDAIMLATYLTGGNQTGVVSFGTEAGLYQRSGIPSVVCGPGSIEQAHKPDEFVDCAQLRQCNDMLTKLGQHLAN